jgi:hypothetical protein
MIMLLRVRSPGDGTLYKKSMTGQQRTLVASTRIVSKKASLATDRPAIAKKTTPHRSKLLDAARCLV